MEKQEFLNKITEIGTCDDDVKRRELLAELSEEAGKDYDNIATLTASNKTLTDANETLRVANMKLFLRVGADTNGDDGKCGNGNAGGEDNKLKFEDLFNEKGGIK